MSSILTIYLIFSTIEFWLPNSIPSNYLKVVFSGVFSYEWNNDQIFDHYAEREVQNTKIDIRAQKKSIF